MTMIRRLTKGGTCLAVLALAMTVLAVPSWAVGTRAGTNITNTARVDFRDVNGNALFQLSNTVSTTVSQVGGVIVDPNNGPVTLDPGDVFYFPHLVTNAGNFDDYINITAVSAGGWPVAIYRDVNGDGLYQPGLDIPLLDSAGDADAIPDSGFLSDSGAGSSMRILVAVTVPAGTADGAGDVTTVTGTSVFDPTKTDIATDTINVHLAERLGRQVGRPARPAAAGDGPDLHDRRDEQRLRRGQHRGADRPDPGEHDLPGRVDHVQRRSAHRRRGRRQRGLQRDEPRTGHRLHRRPRRHGRHGHGHLPGPDQLI
jgi:hypothetical protein